MKRIRMRANHRSVLSSVPLAGLLGAVIVAMLGTGTAWSQPKDKPKDKAGEKAKEGGDEVETNPDEKAPPGEKTPEDEIDMGAPEPAGDLAADMAAADAAGPAVRAGPVKKTPLSWKDIVVVIRKPFLKVRRTEITPMVSTTLNDNMIRHYVAGGEIAYWLTDVLAIGVEGHYYAKRFAEPFDLVARQARRLPTV